MKYIKEEPSLFFCTIYFLYHRFFATFTRWREHHWTKDSCHIINQASTTFEVYLSRNKVALCNKDAWMSSNLLFTWASKTEDSIEIPKSFPSFPGMSLRDTTTLPLATSRGPTSIRTGTSCWVTISSWELKRKYECKNALK